MLTPDLAQRYLESCEIALQRCQQRLDSDGPGSAGDANIMESPERGADRSVKHSSSICNAFWAI